MGAAALLSLAACTSTVQIPATELPVLARKTSRAPGWPTVQTTGGEHQTLMGDVERISLEVPGGHIPVYTPAWTAVDAERLFVSDPLGQRTFRLQDIRGVTVEYDDARMPRVAGGAVLLGLSTPFLLGGTALLGLAAAEADDDFLGPGLIGFGIGAALAIPGFWLVLSNPKPPERNQAGFVRPAVAFTPGGVRFSASF